MAAVSVVNWLVPFIWRIPTINTYYFSYLHLHFNCHAFILRLYFRYLLSRTYITHSSRVFPQTVSHWTLGEKGNEGEKNKNKKRRRLTSGKAVCHSSITFPLMNVMASHALPREHAQRGGCVVKLHWRGIATRNINAFHVCSVCVHM